MSAGIPLGAVINRVQHKNVDVTSPHIRGYVGILESLLELVPDPNPGNQRQRWSDAIAKYMNTYGVDSMLVIDVENNTATPVPMAFLMSSCIAAGAEGSVNISDKTVMKVKDITYAISTLVIGSEIPIRCVIYHEDGVVEGITFKSGVELANPQSHV